MWPVSRRLNKTGTGDDDPPLSLLKWQPSYASNLQQLIRCVGTPSPESTMQVTRVG